MRVKDYYKILEVSPTAPLQEIKRSYRRLAHAYHPDKNADNPAAEAYFKEVIEAYQILSNPVQREQYNYERWSQRQTGKKYASPAFSPQTILKESISLKEYVSTIDIFRMNQDALKYQLMEILSDHNISILLNFKDAIINRQIIKEILIAASPLHLIYSERLIERLDILTENDNEGREIIQKFIQQKRRNAKWNRYKTLLIILITILLCGLIYFLGKQA
jgi:molecular chaperone DnaJ